MFEKSYSKIFETFRNLFSHSSVIGTFNEIDAEIPPHFDKSDIISVIFHAGKVKEGGETLYYNGSQK